MSHISYIFIIGFIAGVTVVNGYSSGAPLNDDICSSLRPNHPAEPQSVKFPYKLRVDKRTLSPEGYVTLTITGRPTSFKGFLVQGRRQNGNDDVPVGTFITEGKDDMLQGIDCFNLENSAVTHRNGDEKRTISVTWKAPKEKGTYVLLTTIVESAKVYWVGQASPSITVQ